MLQDALAKHLYDDFTKATGIKVTAVTINPDEQWAKVKADTEAGGVKWDLVNVGPDSMVLQQEYLTDLGKDCGAVPNLAKNGAPGVCQQWGFLYILGGYILGVNTTKFPNGTPKNAADFFDTKKFPGPRALSGNEPVYNMMIALVRRRRHPGQAVAARHQAGAGQARHHQAEHRLVVGFERPGDAELAHRRGRDVDLLGRPHRPAAQGG